MKVKIIDPTKDKRWDEFVDNRHEGTIFHLSVWMEVINKTYKYIPYYLALEASIGDIKAVWPFFYIKSWLTGTRLVCLPFTDSCFPLLTKDTDAQSIFSFVLEIARRENVSYIETRGWCGEKPPQEICFESHNYYKYFTLELAQGIDSVWQSLGKSSIRERIRKVERSKLQVRVAEEEEDMRVFYNLNLLTRKKHGVLPQVYDFFKNIWQGLILKKLAILMLAEYEGLPIAGILFLLFKDVIYSKFSASDPDCLKYHPFHILRWRMIQYACQNGFKYLDFGRASPDNQGLVTFRRQWGTKEADLPYYYWPSVKGVTSIDQKSLKYKIATLVLRLTPTALQACWFTILSAPGLKR